MTPPALDYDQLARELLVALRGRRSQVQWSRRLGYRSNVAYAWEAGRRSPTAAETLRAVRRSGVALDEVLERFYGRTPPWLDTLDPATPEGVAQLLDDLRGTTSVTDLARRAELSRCSVSRWLSARTQPRLPDFLRVVEAASLRSVDLLACLVDPALLPSVEPLWERLEANRKGAFELPWTQAVLRALELDEYRQLPHHVEGWLSGRLGMPLDEERRCVEFLLRSGRVQRRGGHLHPEDLAVDTRRHPEIGRRLKQHWTRVARERIGAGAAGQFSYNVFTVSAADFERIREMHLRYFHALRAVVAESEPGEVVAVANVQLFPLEPPKPQG
jgi:transcriptional regulator with XRE-family HTH domain